MEKITGNELAYPLTTDAARDSEVHYGLTIRQHFAAMAMQGLLSNMKNGYDKKAAVSYADDAVYLADALIERLNQEDVTS